MTKAERDDVIEECARAVEEADYDISPKIAALIRELKDVK